MKIRKTIVKLLFLLLTLLLALSLQADDLLDQNDFNSGVILPWHISESAETNSDFDLIDGEYVVHIYDGAQNKWDVQIRHRGLTIEKGHTYTVKFKIRASKDTSVYAKIGTQGEPYNEYWNNNWTNINLPAGQDVLIQDTFTMDQPTDSLCEFAFHLGGSLTGNVPLDIFFDDIYLEDPDYVKPTPTPVLEKPDVRVNQLGYFPEGKKRATIVNPAPAPIEWTLKDGNGIAVDSGQTTVFGNDTASGDFVHIADFSGYQTPGADYTLSITVDGKEKASHKFDIRNDLYQTMKYDALQYFYHNRSGIALEMPYAGRQDLTRPAGHVPDVMNTWPGTGQENYSLDVTGGWYDAGDHGKYVVNGGISVWTMMNQYERTVNISGADGSAFADGKMNIPEKNNGYPDILDEARWQMEMLLKMQVPAGKQMAGMVHHKAHDEKWTPLAVRPDQDKETRYLRPVSTAATLNLAATAAQSARIWTTLDPEFSQKCLTAAKDAWQAAKTNPALYAPLHKIGGGPYNDSFVEDEFYWAACELFITTGEEEYKQYIQNSKFYLDMPTVLKNGEDKGLTGVFTWGSTSGLGTVSLSLVPNTLTSTDIATARQNIQAAANYFLNIIENEGYLLPMAVNKDGGYPWGSNSFILNEMIVMGLAYDFSGNQAYFNGLTESMDYIMGRNAMDQCYVSGYGERPLVNPHHRFWAHQADDSFPLAPAGAVSGGPNSGLEDPWAKGAGLKGSPPQKCFIDHIESWSTNEITINWNAPLAWVTAFLDEKKEPLPLSIVIIAPLPGSIVGEGDLLVKTSVTGENIQKVDFYLNDSLVNSDSTAPYQYLLPNLTQGSYTVKATVFTPSQSIESNPVSFTVDQNGTPTPPLVSITSPVHQSEFETGNNIVIAANASDADGQISQVEFFDGPTLIGRDETSPYSIELINPAIGQHTLTARATDNDGLTTVSTAVLITVIDPVVIEDNVIVQYACDEVNNPSQSIRGKLNIVNNGTETINLAHLSMRYYFTNDGSAQPQFNCYFADIGIDKINHSFGTYSQGSYVEISFSGGSLAAAGQTGQIQFSINKSDWSQFNQADDYSFNPAMTTFQEHNRITLYQNGLKIFGIEPDGGPTTVKPVVSITSPAHLSEFERGKNIVITANASDADGQISRVQFFVNSQSIAIDNSDPYSATWTASTEGTYTIQAVATDNEGNKSKQAVISINVTNSPANHIYLPGSIEAEDYTSYYDKTPGNEGGAYKNDDVDIEPCTEGGYNVGWIDSGEWLAYAVSVAQTGLYDIEFRVARETGGNGTLHVEMDNIDVSGPVSIPSTNGWQTFTTITKPAVQLNQGNHTLKIAMDQGPFNLNWIKVKPSNVTLYPLTIAISTPTPDTQTVTLNPAPTHAGDAQISGTNGHSQTVYYNDVTTVTLTASSNNQVAFSAWSGSLTGSNNPAHYSLNSASTITANFQEVALDKIPLTITINGSGSVTLTPAPTHSGSNVITSTTTVYYSDPVQITLQASANFNYWSGLVNGNTNPVTAHLSDYTPYSVTAKFKSGPITGDWLHTEGNRIVDAQGNPVWLTGANWFGFNTGSNAFDGLWSCNLEEALSAMADRGINILRVPISTQLLNEWKNGIYPIPSSINQYVNPNLAGKNSLEIFDITVAHCETIGMKIMLDVHSPGSDAMGHMDPLWYKGNITPQIFVDAWVWFAERYKNNDTIIAYDLENEPHGKPWQQPNASARWDASNHVNNWKKTAEDCAHAILAVNPHVLILIEGIESYPVAGKDYSSTSEKDYHNNWWGGNLRGVKDHPINLGAHQDQLVYSPHDYGPKVYKQPWFDKNFNQQTLYEDCWKDNWAYIMEENIAPLLIGEWGGFMDGGDNEKWMKALRDYMKDNFIHHTFWCFNANSGDTGGLVDHDFKTWDEAKYALLKQVLWQDKNNKFVGLDHDTPLGSNGITVTAYYQGGNAPPVR